MIALPMLLVIPVVMWTVQTALLRAHALPIRWRIDAGGAPPVVRTAGRILTPALLILSAAMYPLLRGIDLFEYYGALLPLNGAIRDAASGAAATTLFLCVLYQIWLLTGQMRIAPSINHRRVIRRCAMAPLTAIFGSVVEEILFRGVVMADLMRIDALGAAGPIAASAFIFAAAHYVRSAKRHWTIAGHLILGLFLSVAFWKTGNLWLAIGLHAGGILMIMGTRPILKYRGPAWLTGASIYPYAGVVGALGLLMMTMMMIG